MTGWNLSAEDRHRFVGRSASVRTFEEAGTLTGITFGSRSSKTLCARVYDKTTDVEVKGTDWWYEVWGPRWRPGEAVTRVEFEFGRNGLAEFALDSPARTLSEMGDMWRYATGSWLTFRTPTPDATRSRWPIASEWVDVADANLAAETIGVDRIRTAERAGSLRKVLPGLNGYLTSFAAIIGTDDIDDTIEAAGPYLRDYETISRVRFSERVNLRRAEHAERVRMSNAG